MAKGTFSNQTQFVSIIVVSALFVLFTIRILLFQRRTFTEDITIHIPSTDAGESNNKSQIYLPTQEALATTQTLVLFSVFWPLPNHLHGKRNISAMMARIINHCDAMLTSNILLGIEKVKWIWIGDISFLSRHVPQCFASNITQLEGKRLTINVPYDALPYVNESNVVDPKCSAKFGRKLGDNVLK
eukprot:599727_1